VVDINKGTMLVKQMIEYKRDSKRYGFKAGDKLNFDYINNQGQKTTVLINDLVAIARNHGMFSHNKDFIKIRELNELQS